jgi:hypothetical protein
MPIDGEQASHRAHSTVALKSFQGSMVDRFGRTYELRGARALEEMVLAEGDLADAAGALLSTEAAPAEAPGEGSRSPQPRARAGTIRRAASDQVR